MNRLTSSKTHIEFITVLVIRIINIVVINLSSFQLKSKETPSLRLGVSNKL